MKKCFYAVPGAPTDVTVTTIDSMSLEVRWTGPEMVQGVITHFTVTFRSTVSEWKSPENVAQALHFHQGYEVTFKDNSVYPACDAYTSGITNMQKRR